MMTRIRWWLLSARWLGWARHVHLYTGNVPGWLGWVSFVGVPIAFIPSDAGAQWVTDF